MVVGASLGSLRGGRMNGTWLCVIATLLTWIGWIALIRGSYLVLKAVFDSDLSRRSRSLKSCPYSFLVAGVTLVVAGPLDAARKAWSIPLVWVLMPFTAWLAVISTAFVVTRLVQALMAVAARERKDRLGAALVWLVSALIGISIHLVTQGDVTIFRGSIPISASIALGIGALALATMALMIWTAKVAQLRGWTKTTVTHLVLIAGSVVFGVPFAWLVVTSFKEDQDMSAKEGIVWVPRVQVTVPFDDPTDPLYETTYKGRSVRASVAEKLKNGRVMLEVTRPYSLQGIRIEADPQHLKRIPKDALVVKSTFDGKAVKALVAQNLADGRQRLRILEPANRKDIEFIALPADTEPVMVTGLRTQNYTDALEFLPPEANMGLTYLKNTLIIVILSLIGTILSSALVAYAFSRLQFPGKKMLFTVLLSTMMLPAAVTMLPTFLIFRSLGWIDTLYPLWVPSFFASAFNVFLLRQFFMGIPLELEDASKLDGCSYLRTFWSVMLPQIKPALAVIAIWTFMGSWNNFMGPLIYISSPEHMPIAYAVQLFQTDRGGEPGLTMAFATMSMVPVLLLFFFAQKYFIEGVQLTGLGGR
jgi:multiple sugar transport system permease protein